MAGSSSSSSSSLSSDSSALTSVKAEPVGTPLGRRTRGIVINGGGGGSSSSRVIKPKTEPSLIVVKSEYDDLAIDDEAALKWAREDYAKLEIERLRRALKKIAARRRGRDEGGVIVLEDSDEDAPPPPPKPVRQGDAGQGSSKDGGSVKKEEADDGRDGDDYSTFGVFFGL